MAAAPAGGRLNVRLTGRTSALVTEPNYRVGAMTVHLVDSVLLTEATYARMEIIATPSYPTMAQAIQSQPDLSRFWVSVVRQLVHGKPRLCRRLKYRAMRTAGAGPPALGHGREQPLAARPFYRTHCRAGCSLPSTSLPSRALLSPACHPHHRVSACTMHAVLRPPLSPPARWAAPP